MIDCATAAMPTLSALTLENVEGNGGKKRIAHSGLLREVVLRSERRALAVPGSPFVDDELDPRLAGTPGLTGNVAHRRPVVGDDLLHQRAAGEQIVVLVFAELKGVASGEAGGAARRVVVDRESPQVAALRVCI